MKQKKLTKRQQQAIETRNSIYNAAFELMDADGFENITIVEISEKAGVSVGSFYHYFKSKHDILAEIFHKADEYFTDHVEGRLRSETARGRIIEYFDHYAQFNILTSVETTRQLFNPKVEYFTEKNRPMPAILEKILNDGIDAGEIAAGSGAGETVRMLFVFARGVVFDWSLHHGDYDLRDTMRRYITPVIDSISTSAGQP